MTVEVELLFFEGCPHWEFARTRLAEALAATGNAGTPVLLRRIETAASARAAGFAGSPSIRIDGIDPFDTACVGGLTCRMYDTENGVQGAPTVAQLTAAIRRLEAGAGHR
ncbi:thioredoxin family protein [Rhodococcus sp. WAY2]|uniref:thioredoxin family protein n=1 Tax=Rhodococcus sp. WAY2 TaxID=2663121 RepID=UPI001F29548E|nr:thioredoxin family protein [Rhodococcus sp. WAY2]